MKTIKEQQTEYVLAHTEQVESYEAYAEKEEIAAAFEAGANYVLDEIERLLSKEDKNLNDYGKALVWRIKDTIEQLKGNQ